MQSLASDMFDEICPSSLSPIRLGDKWTPLVLRCLEDGPRRFAELRVPLDLLCAWTNEHWDELLDARDPVG